MTWKNTCTLNIWQSFLSVIFNLAKTFFDASHRCAPAVFLDIACSLFGAAWTVGLALEYSAVDLETNTFWIKFKTSRQLSAASTMSRFILNMPAFGAR